MTAPRHRAPRACSPPRAWGSALTAAFALIGLLAISGAPGSARRPCAADSYNQMTGIGSTASAITVNWTQRPAEHENQPIAGTTPAPTATPS